MNSNLAQVGLGNIDGIGPLGEFNKGPGMGGQAATVFETFVSSIIGLLTVIAGLWFFIQIILAGVSWIGAGGDKQAIQTSQKKLSSATIGLVIVVASYAIIGLVGNLLGLDIYSLAGSLIGVYTP